MQPLRVRYQTIEFGEIDIHLRTLRDRQQYSDPDGAAKDLGISSALWPIFGIVWPAGIIMARFLVDYNYQNKRILEVGCGIGLSSLLLNHQLADITATDYHPEVETFLDKNTLLNGDEKIPFVRTDWKDINLELGLFDLIIASDLLYEDEHAGLLAEFISRHAYHHCDVIMVDAGRGRHGKFRKKMSSNGFSCEQSTSTAGDSPDPQFKGSIYEYTR